MRKSIIAVSLLFTSLNVNAELFDRGNGMIYDSVQNITWLANANYFAESTTPRFDKNRDCLLYTSDAADEYQRVYMSGVGGAI